MSTQESDAARIFLEAVENYEPARRPTFVDKTCEQNPELRARVFELLKAHGEHNSLLDDERAIATFELSPLENPGTVIGPYKLLRADRRRRLWRGVPGRAGAAGAAPRGAEGHQARHGHARR